MGKLLAFICGAFLAGSPMIGDPALVLAWKQTAAGNDVTRQIFLDVEKGIVGGAVAQFSGHLGPQVYLQLPASEGAYYSANQAFYVLEFFLRKHKIIGLKFTTFGTSESNPYATGNATYIVKGVRQDAQVYVAVARRGDRWVITHLSIY